MVLSLAIVAPDLRISLEDPLHLTATGCVGFLLGLIVALVWHIRTSRRMAGGAARPDRTSRPILGVIPRPHDGSVGRLAAAGGNDRGPGAAEQASPAVPEPYRAFAQRVIDLADSNRIKTLLLTGTTSELTSATAAGLAAALAKPERRVLLISADFRHPCLHAFLRLQNRLGLSHVLKGELPSAAALWSVTEGFLVMTSGPPPDNDTNLLTEEALGRVLEEQRKLADLVIIDCSAEGSIAAARAVAPMVGGVLVVAASTPHELADAERIAGTLEESGAWVAGTVLRPLENGRPRRPTPRITPEARHVTASRPSDHPDRVTRVLAAVCVTGICGLIGWHVSMRVQELHWAPASIYTVMVSSYVISRFVLAACYRPPPEAGMEPEIAIVVPAFNEGEAVARTIHSCMALEYPAEKMELVVVNDGSSDDTWIHMQKAAADYPEGRVRCLDLGSNQGKRAAMTAGVRATSAEILVFIDSDSMPAPNAVRRLMQGFADSRVGALAGLTHVRNASANALTRMQAARYYVSYQLLKAAESVVGAVACCSGCFAAYRRKALLPVLERWEHQRFLGVECTYGDDRSLTNMILRNGWIARYDARAEAWTDAPDRYKKFFRQQLRWKKSWSREGPLLLSHIWRTRPAALPSVMVATLAGLLSPLVLLYNIAWRPATVGLVPVLYALGLYLVSMAYGLLHRTFRVDGQWKWAVFGTFFYVAFSVQLLWAVVRIRDGSWGTRGA
jgi:hyaluronan synthase